MRIQPVFSSPDGLRQKNEKNINERQKRPRVEEKQAKMTFDDVMCMFECSSLYINGAEV